ncbi:MAG TPA: UbiA family prenyltransferase, partial [Stellaceae bacterium]|nr:UbiA family prenyltransferase [Stellaceae bacterium]
IVNASLFVRRAAQARYPIVDVIEPRGGKFRAAIRALRPYQWVKNLLTVVPLLASGAFTQPVGWPPTIEIFGAFCAIASSIYILNDMSDLAVDRRHPRKSKRPFASGVLSIAEGLALLPFLAVLGIFLGWLSGALTALAIYAVLSLAYNFKLKERPLVDIFVLAALYTVRLWGGERQAAMPFPCGCSAFPVLSSSVWL